jgi:hypothetical protein
MVTRLHPLMIGTNCLEKKENYLNFVLMIVTCKMIIHNYCCFMLEQACSLLCCFLRAAFVLPAFGDWPLFLVIDIG